VWPKFVLLRLSLECAPQRTLRNDTLAHSRTYFSSMVDVTLCCLTHTSWPKRYSSSTVDDQYKKQDAIVDKVGAIRQEPGLVEVSDDAR
jgi:hypothetical protein